MEINFQNVFLLLIYVIFHVTNVTLEEAEKISDLKRPTKGLGVKIIIGAILGVGVLLLLLFLGDLRKVEVVLITLPPKTYVFSITLVLLGYAIRFLKWQALIRAFGAKPSFGTNLKVYLIGLGMAITPGKAGELLKPYLLKKSAAIRASKTTAAVLMDRLTDLVAMLVLLAISSLVFPHGYIIVGTSLVMLILGIYLIRNHHTALFIIKMLTPPKLQRFRRTLLRMVVTIQKLLGLQTFIYVLALSVGAWFLECVALFVLSRGLGTSLTLVQDMLVFSLGTVAGAVSALPGGLGAAEGSMVGLFLLFHISRTYAVSLTFLIRLITLWLAVWIGFLAFVITGTTFFKKRSSKL